METLKGKVVMDAACGSSHSACILEDGSLYTWGKGRYGRLGHNDHENSKLPKQVWKNLFVCIVCVCVCVCVLGRGVGDVIPVLVYWGNNSLFLFTPATAGHGSQA